MFIKKTYRSLRLCDDAHDYYIRCCRHFVSEYDNKPNYCIISEKLAVKLTSLLIDNDCHVGVSFYNGRIDLAIEEKMEAASQKCTVYGFSHPDDHDHCVLLCVSNQVGRDELALVYKDDSHPTEDELDLPDGMADRGLPTVPSGAVMAG